jgi:hypothetical protein
MPGHRPGSAPDRSSQVATALRLVWVSVVFGILSGTVSVTAGLADHSLSVLAVGLGVLADVTGSATLVWRFGAERRQRGQQHAAEARSAIVVAAALAVVSVVITVQAAVAGNPVPSRHIGRDLDRGGNLARCPDAPGVCQAPSRRTDEQPRPARRRRAQRHRGGQQPAGARRPCAV